MKQSPTVMIISSVCVEWVFFGASPATNNDANQFWRGFENRQKKKRKHATVTSKYFAAWQFKLYEFNSHTVARATQMNYIHPIGKHFYEKIIKHWHTLSDSREELSKWFWLSKLSADGSGRCYHGYWMCVSRLVHEVKVSGMRRHKLEIQSTDNSNPNTDNFRLIVVRMHTNTQNIIPVPNIADAL